LLLQKWLESFKSTLGKYNVWKSKYDPIRLKKIIIENHIK